MDFCMKQTLTCGQHSRTHRCPGGGETCFLWAQLPDSNCWQDPTFARFSFRPLLLCTATQITRRSPALPPPAARAQRGLVGCWVPGAAGGSPQGWQGSPPITTGCESCPGASLCPWSAAVRGSPEPRLAPRPPGAGGCSQDLAQGCHAALRRQQLRGLERREQTAARGPDVIPSEHTQREFSIQDPYLIWNQEQESGM